jgi:hypothetical protein
MSYAAQVVNRAGKRVFTVSLISVLLAILFCSFTLILPHHQWTVWRVPIRIAAGGAAISLIAWSRCPASRPSIMDGLAAVLGLTSATLGIAFALLIAYGLSLHIAEHTGSRDRFIYQMTNPVLLRLVVCYALIPAVPGAVGVWIVGRRRRDVGRVSMAGTATRFSALGLWLSAMSGVLVAVGALYRLVTWP